MTRSHWQANEYMKVSKYTQADLDRQEAAMKKLDDEMRAERIKERICMIAYYGCWIVTGIFIAYCVYSRQS